MRVINKEKQILLVASVSCADLYNLSADIPLVEEAGIDLLHFDVVDGHFNDCIVLGTPTLQALRPHTDLPIEVHLGVERPTSLIPQFAKAGADYIAVHYEVLKDPVAVFDQIRSEGARPILAFRPETRIDAKASELLNEVDWVLKLTVNPGYSGQPIQPSAVDEIRRIHEAILKSESSARIQADGNINTSTIPSVVAAGATMLTGGTSGLFLKDRSISESAEAMLKAARGALSRRLTP